MNVLLDANVIIDLIEWGCFHHVLDSRLLHFWVVDNVTEEVAHPHQQISLEEELRHGAIRQTSVDGIQELQVYASLREVLADGEAASLAVAATRLWGFATYEKGRTEREALRLLGRDRYLRTPELLATVMHEGVLTSKQLREFLAMIAPSVLGESADSRLHMHLATILTETEQLLSSPRRAPHGSRE